MTILSQHSNPGTARIDRSARSRRFLQRLPALASIVGLWGMAFSALFLIASFVASEVGSWPIGLICTGLVALPVLVALGPKSRGRRG